MKDTPNNKSRYLLWGTFCLLCGMAVMFGLLCCFHQHIWKPQVREVIHTVLVDRLVVKEVPVEIVKEVPVEKEVEVIKQVEVERAVYPSLNDWGTLGEFEAMFRDSVTPLASNGCLSIAETIRQMARNQGYFVSIALAWNGQYYGNYVTDAPYGHAGVLIKAGDSWYFVDPYPWRVTRLFGEADRQ